MTAQELIEKLKKANPEATVLIDDDCGAEHADRVFIDSDGDIRIASKYQWKIGVEL